MSAILNRHIDQIQGADRRDGVAIWDRRSVDPRGIYRAITDADKGSCIGKCDSGRTFDRHGRVSSQPGPSEEID